MRWILSLLLVACTYSTEPKEYSAWYAELESCSGLSGNFDSIRWTFTEDLGEYYGYWTPQHWIQLRPNAASNEHKVKHEMLHDLLQRGDHPAEYFNGKCGNLLP